MLILFIEHGSLSYVLIASGSLVVCVYFIANGSVYFTLLRKSNGEIMVSVIRDEVFMIWYFLYAFISTANETKCWHFYRSILSCSLFLRSWLPSLHWFRPVAWWRAALIGVFRCSDTWSVHRLGGLSSRLFIYLQHFLSPLHAQDCQSFCEQYDQTCRVLNAIFCADASPYLIITYYN